MQCFRDYYKDKGRYITPSSLVVRIGNNALHTGKALFSPFTVFLKSCSGSPLERTSPGEIAQRASSSLPGSVQVMSEPGQSEPRCSKLSAGEGRGRGVSLSLTHRTHAYPRPAELE